MACLASIGLNVKVVVKSKPGKSHFFILFFEFTIKRSSKSKLSQKGNAFLLQARQIWRILRAFNDSSDSVFFNAEPIEHVTAFITVEISADEVIRFEYISRRNIYAVVAIRVYVDLE